MHAEHGAFVVVGHGLNHAAEDVGVDLRPVEFADVQQVAAGAAAKLWYFNLPAGVVAKQASVDVGEGVCPARQARRCTLGNGHVHGAKAFADDVVRVAGCGAGLACAAVAHLLYGLGEQASAVEDVGVFSKKAEDEPRHEVVEFLPALGHAPVGVVFEQLYIEPV